MNFISRESQKCSNCRNLLSFYHCSSCSCFMAMGIVSVVCFIVLSKGIKPFMRDLTRAAWPENLIRLGKHWDSWETKFTVPQGTSHFFLICYIAQQNKSNFWKKGWTSGHLQLHALITCNSGQHFAGNMHMYAVNCFQFDVIVFAMLPARSIWRWTVTLLNVMWPWHTQ